MLEGFNILTIAVLAFLVFTAIRGYRKGFLVTVLGITALVISLLAAHIGAPIVTQMLLKDEKIVERVMEKVDRDVDVKDSTDKADQADQIAALPLPESLKQAILNDNSKSTYSDLGLEGFKEYVVYRIAGMILHALAFVGIFLIFRVATWLIIRTLDLISRLPVLHELNRAAGLLAGVMRGFLVIWVLCIVLTIFAGSSWAGAVFSQIEESVILNKIYNNNLLLYAITKLI
ncbi:MAG: CvpA family protein [Lachnospiraceae bacterium]|nr:CvpA family protein [Lachnospiraceae bacterium]